MSKQVDERVVSMQFDNANFEKNVSQSMSTLEKFKQSLKFNGATKGLEDINAAAGNVNMSGLGGAVEAVKTKFSALEVVGVTALVNITNKAVNAGERLLKSLSIDNVTAGWQKFANKTTSVATLVAQGNAIEDVNDQLSRLNWFTDETSYNFTEMVSNIAKFTATGKDLEASVTAMEGIATWAALSGQNATTASRAMYQLSQAMSAGYMRLEDYKSIQNASMDTEEFRQKTLDAAVALGTLKKNSDGTYQSTVKGATKAKFTLSQFTTQLTSGMWMTSDVMMDVFETYAAAVDSIYETAEEKGMLASEIIDEIYDTAEEKSISTDEAIKLLGYDFDSFALKAFEAAQKARTFTDAIDSVKDALSTAWMNIFELIFGDAEQATELWTDLANTLYDVFVEPINSLSELLEGGLGKSFKKLMEPLSDLKKAVTKVTDPIKEVTKTLEEYEQVVDNIINGIGGWGEAQERWDALTEAGFDWATVQNMINEKLGDSTRHQTDYVIGQEEVADSTEEVVDADAEYIAMLTTLSDAQLKALGLTDEQISAIRAIKKEADKLGISVKEFVENIDELSGRSILINSFKNIWAALVKVFDAVKTAWQKVFPPKSMEERAQMLYDIIAAFHKFTTKLILSDDNAEKLTKTFRGLFSILKLIKTVVGGGFTVAFKILSQILSYFDMNILDVTAAIGDSITAFEQWFDSIFDISWILDVVIPVIQKVGNAIREWYAAFKETPAVQKLVDAINAIRDAFNKFAKGEVNLAEFATSLGKGFAKALVALPGIAFQIGKDFIAGFRNGIGDSITGVIKKAVTFCLNFVASFAEALGVHSPSWKAYEVARDFFQGFINGAKDSTSGVTAVLKKIGNFIVKIFKSIWNFITDETGKVEWGKLIAGGIVIAMGLLLKQLLNAFSDISRAFAGVGSILEGIGKSMKSFSKVLNGIAWDLKAKAMLKMAISLGILVAALWVLTKLDDSADPWKLWRCIGIITVLAGILIGLALAMDKLSSASVVVNKKSGVSVQGLKSSVIQIGLTIALLAFVVKMIGDLDPETAERGFLGLAGLAAGMIVFMTAMAVASRIAGNATGLGSVMLKVAIAMGILVLVIKLIARMDLEDIIVGVAVLEAFVLLVVQMGIANRIAGGNATKFGKTVKQVAMAMLILVAAIWIISKMDPDDVLTGVAVLEAFVLLVVQMGIANRIAGGEANKFGKTVQRMATAMLILTAVIWILSKMDPEDVKNGIITMQYFILLIAEMLLVSKIAGKESAKIAGNLLGMAVAIGILAGVALMLSLINTDGLKKGIAAVGALGLIMAAMIWAARGVKDVKGSLTAMSIAIAIMAASIVALSFIDGDDLAGATAAMGSLMICFALMTKAIRGGKGSKLMVKTLILMTAAVVVLAGLIALLSRLDPKSAISSAAALSVVMLAFAASLRIIGKCKRVSDSVMQTMLSMLGVAFLVGILLTVMSVWGNPNSIIPSAVALGILLNTFASALLILSKGGRVSKSVAGQLGWMTLVAAGLGGILTLMSHLANPDALIPSAIALGILLNTFASALRIIGTGGSVSKSVAGQLGWMTLIAAGLGLILTGMSHWANAATVIPNAIALGILMNAFTSALRIISKGGSVSKSVAGQLGWMTLVAAGLGVILTLMSRWADPVAIIPSAIALGILLNALALAMQIASRTGDKATTAAVAMMAMGLVLFEIADVLILLDSFDVNPSIETALALSILMLALSAACLIVSKIDATAAVYGALGLAGFIAIMGVLVAAIGGLAQIPGFKDILADGGEALGLIGKAIGGFVGGIANGIVSGIGEAIIGLLPKLGQALSEFMVGAQTFITLAGQTDASVVAGAAFIAAAIIALSAANFISGISTILSFGSSFSDLGLELCKFGIYARTFFNAIKGVDASAVEAASNTAEMILMLTGSNLISTLTERIGGETDFTSLGENLKAFGDAIVGFSDTISGKIDVAAVEAAANAGALLVELNKSLPRSGGLLQNLIGEKDFGKFAESCAAFAQCILDINEVVTQEGFVFDSEKIEQLVVAGEAFNRLNTALPRSGGIAQDLAGEKDLAGFGAACSAFVGCMISINEAVSQEGFTVNVEAMNALKEGGLRLNELQNALPKTGGWWQDIAGGKDIRDFGEKIAAFADSMAEFSTSAAGLDNASMNTGINAAYRIKALVESLSGLDTSGVTAFTGIGTGGIGADGPAYKIAQAMVKYSETVTGIDTNAVSVSASAAKTLRALIASLVNLDSSGVENFKPDAIGTKMKSYAAEVAGIDALLVSSSITSANRLKNLISGLANLDSSGVTNFKPESIGTAIKNYAGSVSGINTLAISNSLYAAERLRIFVISLAGMNTSGVASFKKAVNDLSTVNITGMIQAFSGASTKLATAGAKMIESLANGMTSKKGAVESAATSIASSTTDKIESKISGFTKAGKSMATNLAEGLESGKKGVESAGSALATAAKDAIRGKYDSFYDAGSYLVTGFKNGISENSYKATAKATAMAEAAIQAARKALKINSPSKVFKAIGAGIPEGFAMGIGTLGDKVDDSVDTMASAAINSARSAMATVLEAMSGDMDAQPTIRPVVDLSEVKTGVDAIGGLFASTQSVGVQTNLGAINTAMNRRLQNGNNDDVVSAINKLGVGLDNARGDTYNFGNFTYSNGDEISEAVQTLVRAAQVGRRV